MIDPFDNLPEDGWQCFAFGFRIFLKRIAVLRRQNHTSQAAQEASDAQSAINEADDTPPHAEVTPVMMFRVVEEFKKLHGELARMARQDGNFGKDLRSLIHFGNMVIEKVRKSAREGLMAEGDTRDKVYKALVRERLLKSLLAELKSICPPESEG